MDTMMISQAQFPRFSKGSDSSLVALLTDKTVQL